jgi:hypothetical protein
MKNKPNNKLADRAALPAACNGVDSGLSGSVEVWNVKVLQF